MTLASRSLLPPGYAEELDLEPDMTGRFEAMEAPSDRALEQLRRAGRAHTQACDEAVRSIRRWSASMSQLEDEWNDHPRRALVVDDNQGMRVAIRAILEEEFETIDEAANAEDAHALTKKHRYDVVIIDVQLRDGDNGMELMLRIRQRSQVPNVPILMISGDTPGDRGKKLKGEELGRWSDRLGANDWIEKRDDENFLLKEFDREELLLKVRTLISEARPRVRLRK